MKAAVVIKPSKGFHPLQRDEAERRKSISSPPQTNSREWVGPHPKDKLLFDVKEEGKQHVATGNSSSSRSSSSKRGSSLTAPMRSSSALLRAPTTYMDSALNNSQSSHNSSLNRSGSSVGSQSRAETAARPNTSSSTSTRPASVSRLLSQGTAVTTQKNRGGSSSSSNSTINKTSGARLPPRQRVIDTRSPGRGVTNEKVRPRDRLEGAEEKENRSPPPLSPLRELISSPGPGTGGYTASPFGGRSGRTPGRLHAKDPASDLAELQRLKAWLEDVLPSDSPIVTTPVHQSSIQSRVFDRNSSPTRQAVRRPSTQLTVQDVLTLLLAGGVGKLSVLELLTLHDLVALGLPESLAADLLSRVRVLTNRTLRMVTSTTNTPAKSASVSARAFGLSLSPPEAAVASSSSSSSSSSSRAALFGEGVTSAGIGTARSGQSPMSSLLARAMIKSSQGLNRTPAPIADVGSERDTAVPATSAAGSRQTDLVLPEEPAGPVEITIVPPLQKVAPVSSESTSNLAPAHDLTASLSPALDLPPEEPVPLNKAADNEIIATTPAVNHLATPHTHTVTASGPAVRQTPWTDHTANDTTPTPNPTPVPLVYNHGNGTTAVLAVRGKSSSGNGSRLAAHETGFDFGDEDEESPVKAGSGDFMKGSPVTVTVTLRLTPSAPLPISPDGQLSLTPGKAGAVRRALEKTLQECLVSAAIAETGHSKDSSARTKGSSPTSQVRRMCEPLYVRTASPVSREATAATAATVEIVTSAEKQHAVTFSPSSNREKARGVQDPRAATFSASPSPSQSKALDSQLSSYKKNYFAQLRLARERQRKEREEARQREKECAAERERDLNNLAALMSMTSVASKPTPTRRSSLPASFHASHLNAAAQEGGDETARLAELLLERSRAKVAERAAAAREKDLVKAP